MAHYEEDMPCDFCGELGAFYESGDWICIKCLEDEAIKDLQIPNDPKGVYDGERYY